MELSLGSPHQRPNFCKGERSTAATASEPCGRISSLALPEVRAPSHQITDQLITIPSDPFSVALVLGLGGQRWRWVVTTRDWLRGTVMRAGASLR